MTKSSFKEHIRKIARLVAGWPFIGRFVRIAIAIIRLPELREKLIMFEKQQLPSMLQTISEISKQQNLVRSIPVTLRKLTQDLKEKQDRIYEIQDRFGSLSESINGQNKEIQDIQDWLRNLSESVQYLLGRIEFVRRELMYEVHYGVNSPAIDEQLRAKTEIIALGKLVSARKAKVKLNLGCGHIAMEGYLNVDRRPLPGVDIIAEVDELPLKNGEVDEIFSAHLIEHFPQEEFRRKILPYWANLIKPGGVFRAVVPDAVSMIRAYINGEYDFQRFKEVTFGSQDYDGDFHFNMFTPESLSTLLSEAGFKNIEIIAKNRENGGCKEFEVSAIRE
jgi:predicted SAM-dependent methyltransferase/uncharacterized protein YoxC